MRGCSASSDHRDLRQRSKVMDGESTAINVGGHLTVGDAGPDRHRFGFGIEFDLVEML
jgi:hypothetical protein